MPQQWIRRRVWCEPTERLAYVGPPLRRRTTASVEQARQVANRKRGDRQKRRENVAAAALRVAKRAGN